MAAEPAITKKPGSISAPRGIEVKAKAAAAATRAIAYSLIPHRPPESLIGTATVSYTHLTLPTILRV